MSCDEMKPLIYDCISGELDEEAERTLRLHLQSCPACKGYYREIEAVVTGIRRMEVTHPSPVTCLETLKKIERRNRFKLAIPIPRPALAIASVVGLLLIASTLFYYLRPGRMIEMDGRSSTIAQKPLADTDIKRLRREYLDESDLVLTMVLDISKSNAPYGIEDVKKRITGKDLRYAGTVIIASSGGKQKLFEEINSVLKDIMKIRAGGDERQVRVVARSIKRSKLLERIAEERSQ